MTLLMVEEGDLRNGQESKPTEKQELVMIRK